MECSDRNLFFLTPSLPPLLPSPPLLPAPPLLPLSMLQHLLPLLDSSAAAALTKHLRHTLSVCMNQTHALATNASLKVAASGAVSTTTVSILHEIKTYS